MEMAPEVKTNNSVMDAVLVMGKVKLLNLPF